MKATAFLVHALSSLHAGTGHAAAVVDLPTARMKATGIPFIPGSSIKGVLRDARLRAGADRRRVLAVFGPEQDEASGHAGSLVIGDARLLTLPVRSFRGTFAWVTSPLLLHLARRDLGTTAPPVPGINGRGARTGPGCLCIYDRRIYLEDLDLVAEESQDVGKWAGFLTPFVSPGEDVFSRRLVVVDDETMAFLYDTAMQVDARVRLSYETRTVARGALWLEESLPPETVLIGLMAADRSRRPGVEMDPDAVLTFALPTEEVIQIGGKATTGRGRCRLIRIAGEDAAHERP